MDQEIIEQHLIAFVESFVVGSKKERWKELLTRRDKRKKFHDSHKLQSALDMRYCVRADRVEKIPGDTVGVWYDFRDEPVLKTVDEANAPVYFSDAIFSIDPGRLAYYFFHEGYSYRCERS